MIHHLVHALACVNVFNNGLDALQLVVILASNSGRVTRPEHSRLVSQRMSTAAVGVTSDNTYGDVSHAITKSKDCHLKCSACASASCVTINGYNYCTHMYYIWCASLSCLFDVCLHSLSRAWHHCLYPATSGEQSKPGSSLCTNIVCFPVICYGVAYPQAFNEFSCCRMQITRHVAHVSTWQLKGNLTTARPAPASSPSHEL